MKMLEDAEEALRTDQIHQVLIRDIGEIRAVMHLTEQQGTAFLQLGSHSIIKLELHLAPLEPSAAKIGCYVSHVALRCGVNVLWQNCWLWTAA
jgi:hypothetical protein